MRSLSGMVNQLPVVTRVLHIPCCDCEILGGLVIEGILDTFKSLMKRYIDSNLA